MLNQGKNCMGRRAFRKSNKSMQLGLKHHGTHYVEVLFLDPWQCTFLLPNFPNPHQDACSQLCPIILKIYAKFSKSPSGRVSTHESQICLNNNLKECFWWLSWRNLIRNGRLRDSNVAKWMYNYKFHPRSLPCGTPHGTPLTPDKISCFSAQKPRLAQKQQHKQQQQQQTIAKPFQNLSGLDFDWLQF